MTARAVNSAASLGREQFLIIREESNFAKWDRFGIDLASILTWAGRGVMSRFMKAVRIAGILFLGLCAGQISAGDSKGDARGEIAAFDKKFTELHLKMDAPEIMAM
ncbi:MAG: hypothetical protein DMG36_00040 [Acidobacteria bacterium]|nr:MAG: hypothetical protein DMG36_00040 [Acidobacteriota bacterium]